MLHKIKPEKNDEVNWFDQKCLVLILTYKKNVENVERQKRTLNDLEGKWWLLENEPRQSEFA